MVPAAPPPRRPGAGAPAPGRGRQGARRGARRGAREHGDAAGGRGTAEGGCATAGGRAPIAGARPPKGRGGAAVRAARRERHAEAAERRAAVASSE